MTVAIPDLWPDSIEVDVLSPLTILKIQASKLTERTRGIVEAEVVTTPVGPGDRSTTLRHQFDLVAPALEDYRHRLFMVQHQVPLVYPAVIESPALEGGSSEVSSDRSLLKTLRELFASPDVVTVIRSLIARSNEVSPPSSSDILANQG